MNSVAGRPEDAHGAMGASLWPPLQSSSVVAVSMVADNETQFCPLNLRGKSNLKSRAEPRVYKSFCPKAIDLS
jgi:hypothetical protein